jgi:ribonucleoside-diphosphate reductase alpha chain
MTADLRGETVTLPFLNEFSYRIYKQKYSKDGKEEWHDTCKRVARAVGYTDILPYMVSRKFIPGGRYLYSAGRPFHQVNNCFLFRAEDSREGWAKLMSSVTGALMTGGGIGVDYSDIRCEGSTISRTGGQSTGPLALMHMVNEAGRHIMQGGQRRSAIWAGLSWDHPDINKFLTLKDWTLDIRKLKEKNFNFPCPMELTNISVIYDKRFFDLTELNSLSDIDQETWIKNCEQAFRTAEPGMAFNYLNPNESLRNACTEVVSEDDSDKCNLGTVWMNHINDLQEFKTVLREAVRFLMHGAIYSDLPNSQIRKVGARNNRIGVGLGGIHEWLMARGYKYEMNDELKEWLQAYRGITDEEAYNYSKVLGVSEPKGKRAIAPTGTIGILAESTTGIEPLFCKAYLRRYFRDGQWYEEAVIDGTVKRLVDQGIKLEQIEDSYDIGFEQRVSFQADVQDYVDMAISSTCNMPAWGSPENNASNVKEKADILLKYAKRLRGFTCYPDGARGGQPLTRISVEEALKREGVVEASLDVCDISKGGSCGT